MLSAVVTELPSGARLNARTADISRSGCYIDTLNPVPQGSRVRIKLQHNEEMFECLGVVVYVSFSLGMGICYTEVKTEEMEKLVRWLEEKDGEF